MAVGEKEKEAKQSTKVDVKQTKGKSVTKTPAILEDGEITPSTSSLSSPDVNTSRKRKKNTFTKPTAPAKKAKKVVKKSSVSATTSKEDSNGNKVGQTRREMELEQEEKDVRFDQMYAWFKDQQRMDRRTRRSSSISHHRGSHSRSRSRDSHSRSRSRDSRSKSRDRYSRCSSRGSSRSSRSHHSHRRSKSDSTSRSRSRSRSRSVRSSVKEHDLSKSSVEDNTEKSRDLLMNDPGFPGNPPDLQRSDLDSLSQRIETAVKETTPKPTVGPPLSQKLGSLMEVYVGKPEFGKVIKMTETYPRPQNVPSLVTPDLPQDMDKTIDLKVIKEDKRWRNDQLCTGASITSMGKVMDIVLQVKHLDQRLVQAGDMLLDAITMMGYVHNEFNAIRLKGFKQTVNPSFGGVFTAKPDEPEMLMGKTPIAEQVKSVEDLNRLKAKLKKPDPVPSTQVPRQRDFRKRGEYQRRPAKAQRYYNRRRDDTYRRTRYYSPKGNFRKAQQDNRPQEDRKSTRKN